MKIRFVLLGHLPPVALALALLLGCDSSELCRGEACAAANARNQTATCSAGDCVDGGDGAEAWSKDASARDEGTSREAGAAGLPAPDAAFIDAQVPDSCPSEAGICIQEAGECGKDADCRREGYSGVCEEHRCVPCASGERLPHRGCEALTPVCSESSSLDENHCVVCLEDSHCPAEAPHCTDSGCVACRAGGTDCGPESPVCAESTCSACSNHDDCARFEETPVCDSASGSCAECLTDEHCTVAGASRCVENQCVPCDVDADCAHLPSQHLCHEGLCVECYGKETSACETNRVCNMIAGSEAPYSCTHFRAGEANLLRTVRLRRALPRRCALRANAVSGARHGVLLPVEGGG